jgi:hypothetical protein
MGDEAAVDVLKILGTKASLTAAEQQTVFNIIHTAFEQPASIINPRTRCRWPIFTATHGRYHGRSAHQTTPHEGSDVLGRCGTTGGEAVNS